MIRWIALSLFVLAGCASEPRIDLSDTRAIDAIPAVGGNRVGILRDGAQTFPAMFAAMARARDSINLEYFTFDDVQSGGRTLEDLLTDRLRHGVAVSILYDAYGSNTTPPAFLQRLARAGAALTVFNPNPVARGKLDSPNDRDHRKIMVIDGLTAFVGGINLDHVYENQPPYAAPPDDPAHAWWRDTAARIDGPVVADLQRVFFDTWTKQKGAALPPRAWFPALAPRGSQIVRVIPSVPGEDRPLYYVWLLHALRAARQSISLSTGYFVPTHQEREELTHAARRGVRVRLVLPGRSDSEAAIAAGHAAYGDLLEAGARIYEVRNAVLHSKFVVIDGLWTAIGSSNIDRRSATFNNEIDVAIQGSAAAEAEAVFDQDVAMSKEIDLRGWRSRPMAERLREWRARLWEFLL